MNLARYWNRLSFRLPFLIILFSILIGLAVGGIAVAVVNRDLVSIFEDNMTVLRNERTRAVIDELDGKKRLIDTFSYQPATVEAFKKFQAAFAGMDATARAALIKVYTEDNRFPPDDRVALIDGGDKSPYTAVHKAYHETIQRWVQLNNIGGIMFVDLNGDVIYTVQKRSDFGANLLNGPLKDELAGEMYRRTLSQTPPWEVIFSDLRRYPPFDNQPALMMATSVQDTDGKVIGVVLMQLNTNLLSEVANHVKDLGETGEVYIVGPDLMNRSRTRFLRDGLLEKKFESVAAKRAVAGFVGAETNVDYRGLPAVTAYGPIDFMGVRWGMVAKVGLNEVTTPVRSMIMLILGGGVLSVMLLSVIGFAAARAVSSPLDHAIRVMRELIGGNRGVDVTLRGNLSEIRAIGDALGAFKDNLAQTDTLISDVRKKESQVTDLLDTSPVGAIVVTAEDEVLFINEPGAIILGRHKASLIGSTFSFGSIAQPEFAWTKIAKAARRDGFVKQAEITVRVAEKGDTILNVSIRRTAYADRDGFLIWFDDITAQRQADEELRQLNDRFVAFLENTPDFVFIKDASNRFQAASQALARVVGVQSWRDMLGRSVHDLYPKDEADRIVESDRPLLEGTAPAVEYEENIKLGGGRVINASIRKVALKGRDGRISGVLGIGGDITEQKKAEAAIQDALKQAEAERGRGRTIIDSSPDPVVIVRSNGAIDYVSRQAIKMFGYTQEELVGQKIETLIPARVHGAHIGHVKNFFEGGQPRQMGSERNLLAVSKDGREIPVEISLSPMSYGDEDLVIASIRDITARRAAEAALREASAAAQAASNDMLRIIEATQAGTFQCNLITGLISINDRWAEMLGYTKAELDPIKVDDWQKMLHPRDAVTANMALADHLADSTARYNLDVRMRHKDGHYVWINTTGAVTARTADGKPEMFSGTHLDISERKAGEVALLEAKALAESATKAKGDFLASMSHEIRTPMNGITGMADLLAQSQLDDDQKHMLRTIRESGNALITIINDILDISKIEAGKLDMESVSMTVADVLEGVASTLTPNATKKGIRIDTFIDPAIPPALLGDPVRVRQILFNLTGNAVKFSEKKDVAIRATAGRTDDEGRLWVRFDVIDHGIGISPENQTKLFQAFSQAESSTTRKFGGTGLGLAICKRLVEMMGGTVGLTSKEGEGSVFTAEIPFMSTDASQSQEKPRDLSGLRVALVASAGMRQEAIAAYLTHWGADAVTFADDAAAAEAVKKADKEGRSFSSVIFDFGLDAARQDEAKQRFRKALPKRKTPIILLQDYQARGARIKEEDVVTVDANPIIRYRIVTAVAVAAGRASPEVQPDTEVLAAKPAKAPTAEEAFAQGQLILLAEDNLTNQDVIRRQLAMLGFTCEIANNGAEALKAWRKGRYALLLTDCHMPEMDGYELTGAIRTEEKPSGAKLPIIAVTANALQGEAARCIKAGMDDYISKPIAMPALRAALQKWMPPPKAAAVTAPAEAPAPETSAAPVVDERVLKDMFGDDDATFKEIMQSFLEPSESVVVDILAAQAAHDATAVMEAAHKLKSAARNVGAGALADTCAELEAAGKAQDWTVIDALAPLSRTQMDAVTAYINTL